MDDTGRAGRLRTFAIGGVVGAAGAIATARRAASRRRQPPRGAPSGLAAFEDAPCFIEALTTPGVRSTADDVHDV